MDQGTIIAVVTALAGAGGGYLSGRQTVAVQSAALDALQVRVEDQQLTIATIPGLQQEIQVLRGLVTQRANVDKVIEIVQRTESKLDGLVQRSGSDSGQ